MNNTQSQQIKKVDVDTSTGRTKELLDAVQAKYGMVPNTFATMASSPVTLEAFLGLNSTLENGSLSFELRNQIAVLVSELNGCAYCLSAFTAIGKGAGIKDETLATCRMASSDKPKIETAHKFAKELVQNHGVVDKKMIEEMQKMGYGEIELGEIVANIAMITFINYFNLIANTKIDFPLITPGIH